MALISVIVWEVIARTVFNEATIWAIEVATMLGLAISAMGLAYTLRHQGHVRIDVIYMHLSPRGKAIIDVLLTLIAFFPVAGVLTYLAGSQTLYSLKMHEKLIETYWYPPATPIRAVLFLGLFLFALQGVADFIRYLYRLIGKSI
jgi:TRAP-type mannitol/chloroaromatic compound transport system permease small subunit